MRARPAVPRFIESIFNEPRPLVRYLLPFLTIIAAVGVQFGIASFVPKHVDFPYVFFFLIAVFITAWFGGYMPGAITCLITMIGIPWIATPGFRLATVDPSRLILLTGMSALISLVARSQRRQRRKLREANEELDRRVQCRTQELARAVEALQLEVAEHKRTEQALRRSEKRVDFALDVAGIGRWDLDLVTGQVDTSERHNQICGYDESHSAPAGLFESALPQDRPSVEQKFRTALETGAVFESEFRIKHQDGSVRWVWGRGKILTDENGRAASFLGSSRDITDRKIAEQKLQAQLERMNLLGQLTRAIAERQDLRSIYQAVICRLEESLPLDFCAVGLYDSDAREITVTQIGIRSNALAMELAQNARIDADQNRLSRCLQGGLVYEPNLNQANYPFPQRLARGGLRALVLSPLLFESQPFGILIAARCDPESFSSGECEFLQQLSVHIGLAAHQAETLEALQRAYDDLRQTRQTVMQQERLKALGQMASGIAHDINNAISPVALYTEMLLEREPNLSKHTREYLETTQIAIRDVAHTVARMREFYRQQTPDLVLVQVDVNVLIQQVADLTRARWSDMPQQRGTVIELRQELAQDLPPIGGIESEIREALVNLVFNAVDAMPEGGTLTVRTKIFESAAKSRHVDVEVADSGVGMDEQTRLRCLEPFFTTKGERGTGLGLAMVYGVTRRHNGDVEIESAPGQGTTVRLRFPVFVAASAESQPVTRETRPPRLHILTVDDDPLLIRSLRDALEADGHAVVAARGGQEGIDAFRSAEAGDEPFELVITDLGMPHVDGRKVATAIKMESPSTPVILLTGWGNRLVAEGEVPPNVDRVLNKPPKLRELRAALADLAGCSLQASGRTNCGSRELAKADGVSCLT
jgi:PAS domain S-box-containing protein